MSMFGLMKVQFEVLEVCNCVVLIRVENGLAIGFMLFVCRFVVSFGLFVR